MFVGLFRVFAAMLVKFASALEDLRERWQYTHTQKTSQKQFWVSNSSRVRSQRLLKKGWAQWLALLRPSPDTSAVRFQRLEFDSLLSATVMLLIATRTSKVIPDAGCMYRDMQRFVLKVLGF